MLYTSEQPDSSMVRHAYWTIGPEAKPNRRMRKELTPDLCEKRVAWKVVVPSLLTNAVGSLSLLAVDLGGWAFVFFFAMMIATMVLLFKVTTRESVQALDRARVRNFLSVNRDSVVRMTGAVGSTLTERLKLDEISLDALSGAERSLVDEYFGGINPIEVDEILGNENAAQNAECQELQRFLNEKANTVAQAITSLRQEVAEFEERRVAILDRELSDQALAAQTALSFTAGRVLHAIQ